MARTNAKNVFAFAQNLNFFAFRFSRWWRQRQRQQRWQRQRCTYTSHVCDRPFASFAFAFADSGLLLFFFFSFRWTTTMSACRAVEAAAAASAAAPWPTHVYHFLPFCSNAKPFIHKMWTSTIVMRTQHNGGWVAASSPASSDTFAHSIIACDSNVVVTKCTRHTDTATQSLYINL